MTDYHTPAAIISGICTLFIFFKIHRWLGFRLWLLPVWLLLAGLVAWFPIYPYLEAYPTLRELYAVSGTAWAALAVVGAAIFLLIDIIRLAVWLYYRRLDGKGFDFLPPRFSVPLALILLICFGFYGAYEAKHPRVVNFGIKTDKLPEDKQLRIVFVSDTHLRGITALADTQRLVDIINEQEGDILLFGGDIVSGDMQKHSKEAHLLAQAMPKYGSFGVLGCTEPQHDHLNNALPFLSKSWIHVMRGEALAVGGISLAGVDDPQVAITQGSTIHDPMIILERLPRERFTILLKHQPTVQPESIGLFDLQLSGHSLGGQIWPGKYLMEKIYGTPQGELTQLSGENGKSWFYASNGSGFYRLPLRFFTPPEVVVIDLVR